MSTTSSNGLTVDLAKILLLMEVFAVDITELAKLTKFSRSYVSKILSEDLHPSTKFLAALCQAIETMAKNRMIDGSFFLSYGSSSRRLSRQIEEVRGPRPGERRVNRRG